MYDVTLWVFSVELASCHFPGTDNSDMVTYIHILQKCVYLLVYGGHLFSSIQIISQHNFMKVQIFWDVTLSGSSSPTNI
jgi:hypothetical protein